MNDYVTIDELPVNHHKCFICGKTKNKLFRVPTNPKTLHGKERLKKWEEFLGPTKELLKKKKINHICSIHFADRDFQTPSRIKLNNYCVPSLHPPEGNLGKGGCSYSTSISSSSPRKESSFSPRTESSRKSPDPPDTLATNTSLDLSLIEDEKKRKFIESITQGYKRNKLPRWRGKSDKGITRLDTECSSKDKENKPIENISNPDVSIVNRLKISSSEPRLLKGKGGCSYSTSSSSSSPRKESSFSPRTESSRKSPDPPDTLATNTSLDLSLIEDEKKRKFIESITQGYKRNKLPRWRGKSDKGITRLDTECSSKDKENKPIKNISNPEVSIVNRLKISSSEPRLLKVVGPQNLQGPSVIKSVLKKVNLKKKDPVYVVPLKNNSQLTKDELRRIIENLPIVSKCLKVRLLSAINYKPDSVVKQNYPNQKKEEKKKSTKLCTCTVHCNKYIRRKPVIKVSPSVGVKIEGVPLASDTQLEFPDDNASSIENLFTVSTILTNVNDKSQLQQLCQLLIESIFRLKNVNTDGTMSKLVVYLTQGCLLKSYDVNEEGRNVSFVGDSTCQGPPRHVTESNSGPFSVDNVTNNSDSISILNPSCEKITNSNQTSCQQPEELTLKVDGGPMTSSHVNITQNYSNAKKTSEVEGKKKHVRINLNAFHDHNYLSYETGVLFEKPSYLVNLINIDKFKSSKKKTRITRCFPKKLPKKYQQEVLRLRRQIIRFKQVLKKKNNNILKMNSKIKYLATVLCTEKGLKKIRYPKIKQMPENQLHDEKEVQRAMKNITSSEVQGYVKVKRTKDKDIDKANIFVPSLSGNNRSLPIANIRRDNLESSIQQTSHGNFDETFQHFMFIEDRFEMDVG